MKLFKRSVVSEDVSANAPTNLHNIADTAYRPAKKMVRLIVAGIACLLAVFLVWTGPKANLVTEQTDLLGVQETVKERKIAELLEARSVDSAEVMNNARTLDRLLPREVDSLDVLGSLEEALLRAGIFESFTIALMSEQQPGSNPGTLFSEVELILSASQDSYQTFSEAIAENTPKITVKSVNIEVAADDSLSVKTALRVWSMPNEPTLP